MGRFFVPSLPFLAILFAEVMNGIAGMSSRPVAVAIGATLILVTVLPGFDVHPVPRSVLERINFRWKRDTFRSEYDYWILEADAVRNWSELGRALAEHTSPGESLVRLPIGAVGYYSNLTILDQMGLVDPGVARIPQTREGPPGHDKIVPKGYFLKFHPTYMHAQMVRGLEGKSLDAFLVHFQGRWSDQILSRYGLVRIPLEPLIPGGPSRTLLLMKRKDLD